MNTSQKSIVFITGTFISNNCWDEWKIFCEEKGYTCTAPPWPYKDASPEELRNRPANDAIALNTITSLTEHFASIVCACPEKPILIGHSLGGLVVQLLLQRGLGIAGVAIHSFPPSGISSLRFAFMKALWEAMDLFSSKKRTYLMPFTTWRYAIANGIEYEQQKELYYLYAIPESKKIIREAFRCVAKIDYRKRNVPLLFISGSKDKLALASLNYSNYKKYGTGNSETDYIEFKAHNHLVFGVPAWRQQADVVLHWLQALK